MANSCAICGKNIDGEEVRGIVFKQKFICEFCIHSIIELIQSLMFQQEVEQ